MGRLSSSFDKVAHWTARHAGRASTFALALAIILVWGVSGPLFQWSDTWQLIINTGTTIVTFLMVFLIQNTQNRDTEALQLKLDELIRVNEKARNRLLRLEELSEEEMDDVKKAFTRLAKTGTPLSDEDEQAEDEQDEEEPAVRPKTHKATVVEASKKGD
jgi:low affinity Fe/Cu permease